MLEPLCRPLQRVDRRCLYAVYCIHACVDFIKFPQIITTLLPKLRILGGTLYSLWLYQQRMSLFFRVGNSVRVAPAYMHVCPACATNRLLRCICCAARCQRPCPHARMHCAFAYGSHCRHVLAPGTSGLQTRPYILLALLDVVILSLAYRTVYRITIPNTSYM